MRDPFAAESSEMAGSNPRAALIVRQEAKRVGVLDLREHIDHWQAERGWFDRSAPVGPPRGDHETVDALAQELIDVAALTHRIVGGVAHEHGDAMIGQAPLEQTPPVPPALLGQMLGVIRVPEVTANFNWGDADRKTLYICATSSLYSCRTLVPGPAGA